MRFLLILVILLLSSPAFALGRGPGARAAAMGGAYSALAYGIESYGFNPAGMAASKTFALMLAGGGNSTMTYQQAQDLYQQLSTGAGRSQYLSDNIFKEIRLVGQGDVPFVGVSLGNLGIASWGYAYGYADKRAVDYQFILLAGYVLDYGLIYGDSFGRLFPSLQDFSWGITARNFQGGERSLHFSALNFTQVGNNLVNYASDGSTTWKNGLGGDLGVRYEGKNYIVGLALKDLASSFSQTNEYNYRQVDYANGSVGGIIGTFESTTKETLNPWWILGFAYYLDGPGIIFSTDVKRYKTTAISPSDSDFNKLVEENDMHVGLEKKVFDWLVLRGGFSAENANKLPETWLTYGLGLNPGFINIDFAAGNGSRGSRQLYLQTQAAF